ANSLPSESIDASNAATQTTPGAIDRRSSVSGPIPKGNKLTTMTKKNKVDSASARRRHARMRSRQTIQRNIDRLEGAFTLPVRGVESNYRPTPNPGESRR